MKRVKECTGHSGKHGVPAQQAEQGIDQRILDIMHRCICCRQLIAHQILNCNCNLWLWQHQRQFVDKKRRCRERHPGLTKLASQSRQDTRQLLLLGIAFRRIARLFGKFECQARFANTLQHPDCTNARTWNTAASIQLQRPEKLTDLFVVLRDLEQKPRTPTFQPIVVQNRSAQVFQNLVRRLASIETFAALMQVQVGLDIVTTAKSSRLRTERDFFILVNAKIGQHELSPILAQITEEHEPQTVAQHDNVRLQMIDTLVAGRLPVRKCTRLGIVGTQCIKQIGFPDAGTAFRRSRQAREFRFVEQPEQLLYREQRTFIDPTLRHQCRCRYLRVADFLIYQFSGAKQRPLAHHHPDQQGA